MPVGGGRPVDRPAQVEVAHDRGRAQVEVLDDEAGDLVAGRCGRVPNVSTSTLTGCATPIAYATCSSQRRASPAATTFLATQRAA